MPPRTTRTRHRHTGITAQSSSPAAAAAAAAHATIGRGVHRIPSLVAGPEAHTFTCGRSGSAVPQVSRTLVYMALAIPLPRCSAYLYTEGIRYPGIDGIMITNLLFWAESEANACPLSISCDWDDIWTVALPFLNSGVVFEARRGRRRSFIRKVYTFTLPW